MSVDPVVSILWDVLKWVVIPIKRQFGYVMSSKRYARDLQKEVGKLESEDERIQNAVREAGDNLRHVHSHVSEWQGSAEKVLRESGELLGDFEKASKTCCYGTLPDPNFRYQFSRKAKDKIEVIQDLARKGCEFKELNDISSRAPAPGIVTARTRTRREGKEVVQSTTATASASSASTSIRDDGVIKSRAQMIRDIIDALADNSNRVVGVYGMGGVGKSTLLVDTERRIREEKSFDLVAKADVSENPDVKRIQGEIAHSLGLDIKNEEYINVRAERLHTRLEKEEREKKKVLIILDNLWERLDLDKVGIPCGPGNKARGCKLLLTARDQRVLRREMLCDSAFLLGGLENVEAKRLFEKTVGGKVTVELEPLVEEALRISAGLPFLIVAISKLFIDTSYSECDYALKQIWSEDTGKVITKRLQLSYGRISEEAKSLLRLCVAYGVSKPYPDYLARYGFGLRIFQGVSSVQEARVRLGSLIHTLQASSLLLDGEEDAGGFKIHDLVREFVASFASTNRPLLILKDKDKWETTLSEERLKICEAICFPYVDLEELPKELICPELRIFLLLENERSLEISDSYFNSMKNLMALDLSGIRLSRSPSPFQFMENLHTLCVDDCSVEDVSVLGKLKGLQILSLQHSDIQQLPKEIGQLTELRLLDLDYCSKLQIIEPGVLGRLTKLEELYMKDSFDRWSAGEQTPATNAGLIELNNMKNLRTLHVSIPNPSALPRDLDVEKLTKYKIQIGDVRGWGDYKGSRMLELNLDGTSDVLRKECFQSILAKADALYLYKLDRTEKSISALSSEGFPKLKHLQVEDSPSFRCILERSSLPTFEALETLLLNNLINLEKILCTKNISIGSFSTLKVVRVEGCDKIEVLFPRSVARELPQLEEIKVVGCKLMRGIVEADGDRGKFELPKLRVLKLYWLPNIENFITTGSSPSRSTSDDQIGTQIAFFNGQQDAFPHLETLEVNGLDNIGFMFSPSMVKSLAQLRKLNVSFGKKMEAIITEEEGLAVEISETLAFPMLAHLSLQYLKSLKCFSHSKCKIDLFFSSMKIFL
ncbi:probable disease resistance protein At4g27220 [Rhodamnia argentea]|uniref:Probable disease resistance protein At4g27220 n=1 Tax=Rhodamnia argentea TaxID=178133 RepID=A0A8B8NB19_9MYRT|nr:probable disease resistance protein At4g27220 [Rhodamnia argentea]